MEADVRWTVGKADGAWKWAVWRLIDIGDARTKTEAEQRARACARAERESGGK